MHVRDDRNGDRKVQVFFRYPESETERTYPFITIENIDINHARPRQHSETVIYTPRSVSASAQAPNNLTYWPSENPSLSASAGVAIATNEFTPLDLLYQISTFSRTALHDRQLTSMMLKILTPFRYGFITVESDNTLRRFELLDWIAADLLDPESGYRKRIFRKIYTVQMSAELPPSDVYTTRRVSTVSGTVNGTSSQLNSRITPATITEVF
jgi:hypothetical protein